VKSRVTRRFRRAFAELPDEVKERARDAYRLFRKNPDHPSLRFKRVHPTDPIYSVRIGLGYRAVGAREGDTIYRYWIGGHADYDRLIS
jgi:hypothetical protein